MTVGPCRRHDEVMADLGALALVVAFFALALALVKGCELIIGPDVEAQRTEPASDAEEQVAA